MICLSVHSFEASDETRLLISMAKYILLHSRCQVIYITFGRVPNGRWETITLIAAVGGKPVSPDS